MTDIIVLDIPGLFGLAFVFIVLCNFQGNIFDKFLQPFADLVDIFVDVPPGYCFEQVLQILNNFNYVEDELLIFIWLGDQQHQLLRVLFVFALVYEQVQGMEDLLECQVDIAAEVGVADRVFYFYHVVVGHVADQFCQAQELLLDDEEVDIREGLPEQTVLLPALEVVQFVEIGSQVSDDDPAVAGFLQYLVQKLYGVHIAGFTDVDNILVLYQCAEDLEESCEVEKLR